MSSRLIDAKNAWSGRVVQEIIDDSRGPCVSVSCRNSHKNIVPQFISLLKKLCVRPSDDPFWGIDVNTLTAGIRDVKLVPGVKACGMVHLHRAGKWTEVRRQWTKFRCD